MHAHEVVVHEVNRCRSDMVFSFLRKSVRFSSHSAKSHSHRQVLTFTEARRDVCFIRLASDPVFLLTNAHGSFSSFERFAVLLDRHGKIDVTLKRFRDSIKVRLEPVGRDLNSLRESLSEIVHEHLRMERVATTDEPVRNDLGVRTNRRPGPQVTHAENRRMILRKVLFLRVTERPDFVALDSTAGKIGKDFVLKRSPAFTEFQNQSDDGVLGDARNSGRATNAHALYEAAHHLGASFYF